ncbi:MAG: VWA domain-containing protein [Clostridia bacterium]|nr:VWA domain-containing protein [Clostridia bacterium]
MKKIIILLLILSSFLVIGCKKKDNDTSVVDNKTTDLIEESLNNNELAQNNIEEDQFTIEASKAMWTFEEKPIGEWPEKIPYINPFYSFSAYDEVEYLSQSELYISYVDPLGVLFDEVYYGEMWTLLLPVNASYDEVENMQLLYDFSDYLERIDGKIIGRYGNSLAFQALEGDVLWFGSLFYEEDYFTLNVIKANMIFPGEKITISEENLIDGHYYAISILEGNVYYSLLAEKAYGDALISLVTDHSYGQYRRAFNQTIDYVEEFGETLYMDSLPYDTGIMQWDIEFYDDYPEELNLTLLESGIIPEVQYGEAMGAIKVSAEYVQEITIEPTAGDYLSLDHAEFYGDLTALDVTPDGDFIVYVPAGLWDVNITPKGDALVSVYSTTMVPVNSGQMTEVIIPPNVSKKLQMSSGYTELGLEIKDIEELNNKISMRFTILDNKTKEVIPNLLNTVVYEGGYEATILEVKPVETPAEVVLLLDSSGSMKGQMTQTLDAAKAFVQQLPEDTIVHLVDFDSKPKLLEGTTKETVLKNLSQITVGGATTLHDAVLLGLDLLENAERPNLILFTDGFDANLNDTDRGSEATFEEMMDRVKENNISIYTIGFGLNHDVNTLDKLASATGGVYYPANDQNALSNVFDAINEKIINTYDLTYERPMVQSKSDIPVVSVVIDTSGSMNESTADGSYRLLKVKQLFHDFFVNMSVDAQFQLTEFNDETSIVQSLTTKKPLMLRALANLQAGGGTDIEGSVEAAYRTMKYLPASKKVIIYITDAALGTRDSEDAFKNLLGQISESDISVLWVGLGVEDAEEDFILAAELSGGSYVISEDSALLEDELNRLLNRVIEAPKSELVNVFLSVEKENDLGVREVFSTSRLAELSPKRTTDEIVLSETIQYRFTDFVKQYDGTTATKISSSSLPISEVIISNRMVADGKGQNKACEVSVNELYFIDKLNGVAAPDGYQFMALDIEMKNILPEQEVMVYPDGSGHPSSWVSGGAKGKLEMKKIAYQIPNFISHLYLTFNNKDTVPASTATWLMGEPIVSPGNYTITILPDSSVKGLVTFLIPDDVMNQTALHFYDTNYGHIHVPIVGEVDIPFELENMPTTVATNLTDTFGLSISERTLLNEIGDVKLEDKSVFALLKGNFTSSVQALLDIDPSERMSMRIKTENGDFYIPVSPLTVLNPGGFYQPRMMAPGAQNYVNMVFHMPEILAPYTSELFIDLYDEDKVIPIENHKVMTTTYQSKFEHEYFNLYLNDVFEIQELGNYDNRMIVVDITVEDIKDSFATSGISSMLMVAPDNVEEANSVGLSTFGNNTNLPYTPYSEETGHIILGFTDETVVYDGTSRRGFIIYEIPKETGSWHLYSPEFEAYNQPVTKTKQSSDFLMTNVDYIDNSTFEEELSDAINEMVTRYALLHPEDDESLNQKLGLDETSSQEDIATPMLSTYGNQILSSIKDLDDLFKVMKAIDVIPSNGLQEPFEYNLSPEALVIQNYGTEQDLAHLAYTQLAKLGYAPKLQVLHLTPRGKEIFEKIAHQPLSVDVVPGVRYNDGKDHLLILPFCVLMEDIDDLVVMDVAGETEYGSTEICMDVTLYGEYTEHSMTQQFSDMGDALSGETEMDHMVEVPIYYGYLPMSTLSLDAIDFGVGVNGSQARFYMNTADGEILGDEIINPDYYDFKKIKIEFILLDGTVYTYEADYNEGMSVDQLFMTASINAPDLNSIAGDELMKEWSSLYDKISNPSTYTALRWYDRSMLNQFHYQQQQFNQLAAQQLDLKIGHINKPKIIIVTNRLVEDQFYTSIDLLQAFDEVFIGEDSNIKAFNIMAGMYASTLEQEVMHHGTGLEGIWSKLPEGSELYVLEPYITEEVAELLRAKHYPEELIAYFRELNAYVIIPDQPAIINGYKRYAWLEGHPDTYEVIAVLDDFTHGAGVEATIIDTIKGAGQFALGAFKGVETSLWSVAAFSLEESDYKIILEKAKAFALGLADNFGVKFGDNVSGSIGGTISASQSVGPVNFTFDGKFDAKQGVLGYTEGYIEGVKLYFDIAK